MKSKNHWHSWNTNMVEIVAWWLGASGQTLLHASWSCPSESTVRLEDIQDWNNRERKEKQQRGGQRNSWGTLNRGLDIKAFRRSHWRPASCAGSSDRISSRVASAESTRHSRKLPMRFPPLLRPAYQPESFLSWMPDLPHLYRIRGFKDTSFLQ